MFKLTLWRHYITHTLDRYPLMQCNESLLLLGQVIGVRAMGLTEGGCSPLWNFQIATFRQKSGNIRAKLNFVQAMGKHIRARDSPPPPPPNETRPVRIWVKPQVERYPVLGGGGEGALDFHLDGGGGCRWGVENLTLSQTARRTKNTPCHNIPY